MELQKPLRVIGMTSSGHTYCDYFIYCSSQLFNVLDTVTSFWMVHSVRIEGDSEYNEMALEYAKRQLYNRDLVIWSDEFPVPPGIRVYLNSSEWVPYRYC